MKFKYLVISFFLLNYLSVAAQKRSDVLEKRLETIKNTPDNPQALLFLCEYYLQQGDYSKTVTYAEYMKNLPVGKQNPTILFNAHLYLGQAQMMSGREKAARKSWRAS